MSYSLSGTVGATTLTEKQIPSHKHKWLPGMAQQIVSGGKSAGGVGPEGPDTGDMTSAGGSQSHTHSLSGLKSGSTSSLPPYHVLAFIMRIA